MIRRPPRSTLFPYTTLDQTDPDAQRLLFSATLDGEVDSLVRRYLKDPARHEVVRPGEAATKAEHLAYSIAFRDKVAITKELASRPGRTIVFARTQLGVDRLTEHLVEAGIRAEAIHGGLPQSARRRALEAFTDARSPVLVATDVAARGIHVDDVSLVLHYDPPAEDRKSTRLNSSHANISYAVFCLKKKKNNKSIYTYS